MYHAQSMHPFILSIGSVTKPSSPPRVKPWLVPFYPMHDTRELLDWLCKHPWITHTDESEIEYNILYLFL
jgi:hypothetical protein